MTSAIAAAIDTRMSRPKKSIRVLGRSFSITAGATGAGGCQQLFPAEQGSVALDAAVAEVEVLAHFHPLLLVKLLPHQGGKPLVA